MYQKVEKCPVCQSTSFINHIIATDHSVSGESFAISKCKHCTVLFTNPRPDSSNIGKYYESPNYISHADKPKGLVGYIYQVVRKVAIQQKLKLIAKTNKFKKGRLLDIGCGTGTFINAAKIEGWEVEGVEKNPEAAQISTLRINQEIYQDLLELKTKEKFQIITMWHVLEHIEKLDETIEKIKSLLHSKGKLIVAVPNHLSKDAKEYGEHWAAYDVPRHLYHFNEQSIKTLFERHQMKVKKILPMYFDAYYISLMSEKFKNGKMNPFKSLRVAYKSNQEAKKNKQYSSQIFVIKK